MKKAKHWKEAADLRQIPNIGPAMVADFELLGVRTPHDLKKQDPYRLYEKLCRKTGARQDPCVLDTFIAATRFMKGDPARPWWHYTKGRKKKWPEV